jgi:hypothetical protein
MADLQDDDLAAVLVDAVPHAILTPPGPPQPFEWFAQRHPDNPGPVKQRAGHELPCRECDGPRQRLTQGTSDAWRHDKAVWVLLFGWMTGAFRHCAPRGAGVLP